MPIARDNEATTIYEVRVYLGDGWFYRDWYGHEAMALSSAQEAQKAGREVEVIAITYDDVETETVAQSVNLTKAEKPKPPKQEAFL